MIRTVYLQGSKSDVNSSKVIRNDTNSVLLFYDQAFVTTDKLAVCNPASFFVLEFKKCDVSGKRFSSLVSYRWDTDAYSIILFFNEATLDSFVIGNATLFEVTQIFILRRASGNE